MPEITFLMAVGVVLLGAVIGFLSGLFGVGGGFLLTPMLNIAFNIPMEIAVGSSLCQMIGTGTTATLRHWKESAVDVKLALVLLGGTVGGVVIGTEALESLGALGSTTLFGHSVEWAWLTAMCAFVVLMLVVGIGTLVESLRHRRAALSGQHVASRAGRGLFNRVLFPPVAVFAGTEGRPVPLVVVVYIGFGVGVLQGFLGIGGGIVFLPALVYGLGCSTRSAVGTSLLVIVLSSVAGTVAHALHGNVDLGLVALILASSTLGAGFGAALHHRLKAHEVRLWFVPVLGVALVVIVLKMLAQFGAFGG